MSLTRWFWKDGLRRGARGLSVAAVFAASVISSQGCGQKANAESGQERMSSVQEKMRLVQRLAPEWVQSGGEARVIQARMQQVRRLLDSGKLAEAEAELDDALALVRTAGAETSSTEPKVGAVDRPKAGDVPKDASGSTALGLPLSPYEGMKRPQEALDRMREASSSMFGVRVAWSKLEPRPGRIDFNVAPFPMLELVEKRYPEMLDTFVVSVRVVTTTVRTMPKDLERLAFDDPRVLERIDGVVDALASHELADKVDYLLLGQETDVYLGRHPDEVDAYARFLRHAAERARVKLPGVQVATTITFGGIRNRAEQLRPLLDASALGVFTYYPLGRGKTPRGNGWIMRPVSEVTTDLQWIAKEMGNGPFAFLEIGYSAHAMNLGSEDKQAEFVREAFTALEPYRRNGRLRFVQYWMMYDYPPELSEMLAKELGTEERGMVEYMSTLGLREYANKGRARPAWDVYVEQAERWRKSR